MSALFKAFKVKDLTLKNRIVMAPMCMYSATLEGHITSWHPLHYGTRAVGGTGLIIIEATAVESRGRISDRDLGIWNDDHIVGLKEIVNIVHQNGAKIGIQLAHAGRKCEVQEEAILAPSAIAHNERYKLPIEMTQDHINEVIDAFRNGAKRALEAGFDIVEIHGAHGYLINQFLSPIANKRTDHYGGSLENRLRFLKEVITAVRESWPIEKPVILRVSAEEYDETGNTPQTIAEIINAVKALGVDIVNVSSGGIINVPIHTYPGYQLTMAETIKEVTQLPILAGGLVTNELMADEVLENHRSDLIYLGRELLRNPYWPLHAAKSLSDDIVWPVQYERSK